MRYAHGAQNLDSSDPYNKNTLSNTLTSES